MTDRSTSQDTASPAEADAAGRTLVIDCATEACSVALLSGDTLLAGDWRMLGRGHAEALVPMIAALPDRGRAGTIAVALGPGSFTGVRVGIATARALALAWRAQTLGYSTLALVAAQARSEAGAGSLSVAMTGGHGEWFVESFDAEGRSLHALSSLRPDVAATTIADELVAGTQSEALVAARGHGRALPLWPDARAFRLLPAQAIVESVQPLYGRAPDARLPGGRPGPLAAAS